VYWREHYDTLHSLVYLIGIIVLEMEQFTVTEACTHNDSHDAMPMEMVYSPHPNGG